MSKGISIAILDSDKEYIDSFNEYMKDRKCSRYSIEFFTDIMALDEYCKKNRFDMLVIAEYLVSKYAFEEGNIQGDDRENIAILVDDSDISSIEGISVVYRYQPVEMLINSILNLCAERELSIELGRGYERKGFTKLIGVYSPIGRCGKTVMTINVGLELTRRDFKVLLINLEEFSLLMVYLNNGNISMDISKECGGDLSDLLYFYLSGNGAFDIKAEAIIGNYNGLDFIPPTDCIRDLRNTDTQKIMEFVKKLGDIRSYDVILIDLSNMVEDIFKVIEVSDMVIMPLIDDKISDIKLHKFREYMANTDYDISQDKFFEIRMNDINDTGNRSHINNRLSFSHKEYLINIVDEIEKKIRGD